MTTYRCASEGEAAERAFEVIRDCIQANPQSHLCLATGASPLGAYRRVAEESLAGRLDASRVRITKLDEWIGIPMAHEASCESYLRKEVLGPWSVPEAQYLAFDSEQDDQIFECRRIENRLETLPPFDLCVLGVGSNGHLGLNEPANSLVMGPHIAELAPTTRYRPMLQGTVLTHGLTLGIGNILGSRRVLLIVMGASKQQAWDYLQDGEVSTQWPVSLLNMHDDVVVVSTL